MFSENLITLRKLHNLTQEELAEKVGVTRQALAKWESGETLPDIEKCRLLAECLDVTLDNLANYEPAENHNIPTPPKGKHFFGIVKVGDKGQIVIPAKARKIFAMESGTELAVLGDEPHGIGLVKAKEFLHFFEMMKKEVE